jgi:hypothetical protein
MDILRGLRGAYYVALNGEKPMRDRREGKCGGDGAKKRRPQGPPF